MLRAADKHACDPKLLALYQVLTCDGVFYDDRVEHARSAVRGKGTTIVLERGTGHIVRYDCRFPNAPRRHPASVLQTAKWPSGRYGTFVLGPRRLFRPEPRTAYQLLRGEDLRGCAKREFYRQVRSAEDDARFCLGAIRFTAAAGGIVVADGLGLIELNSGARRLLAARDPRMTFRRGAAVFDPHAFPGVELLHGRYELEHALLWRMHSAGELPPAVAAICARVESAKAVKHAAAVARLMPPTSYPVCIRRGLGLERMPSGKPPRNAERYVAVASVTAALRAGGVSSAVIFSGELLAVMLAGLRRAEPDAKTAANRERKFLRLIKQLAAGGDVKEYRCRRVARETSLCPHHGDGSAACGGVVQPSGACVARGVKRSADSA